MFNLQVNIKYFLIFIFFTHGALYYLFPGDIHNTDSFLKYIKYIIIVVYSICSITEIKRNNFALFAIIAILLLILMIINHSVLNPSELLNRYMSYIAPFSIIFLKESISNLNIDTKKIRYVLIITLFFGFLEFFFFEGIFSYLNFSETAGYVRVATVFLNPNNAGLMIFIMLMSVVPRGVLKWSDIFLFLLLFFSSVYVILLTGSRTAIVLILLYVCLVTSYKFRGKIIINSNNFSKMFRLIILGIPFAFYYLLKTDISSTREASSTRDLSENSWLERFDQINLYYEKISIDFLAPDYFNFSTTYDNAYIQFWSDFGFWGIIFLIISLIMLFKTNLKNIQTKSLVLSLLIAGFSINIFYLWPTSYILWYLLLNHEKK